MDTSPSPHFKQRLDKIEAFVFDNDGVFTNGTVYLMPGGEQVRTASTRDGYAVQHAAKCGVKMAMITGGRSDEVIRRMNGLGVTEVITGAAIKNHRTRGPLRAMEHFPGSGLLYGRRHSRHPCAACIRTRLLST